MRMTLDFGDNTEYDQQRATNRGGLADPMRGSAIDPVHHFGKPDGEGRAEQARLGKAAAEPYLRTGEGGRATRDAYPLRFCSL